MHVIRHDHVSAYGDVKVENAEPPMIFDRTLGKASQRGLTLPGASSDKGTPDEWSRWESSDIDGQAERPK